MAAYVKYERFIQDLCEGKHDVNAHQFNVTLSNTAPNAATHAVKADIAEIAAGNGFTADGIDTLNTGARAGGTYTMTGTKAVWTATGAMAAFRYVIIMNVTQATPLKPLMGYWDYGSSLNLAAGETFSWKPNNSDTTGTIATFT